MTQCFNSRNIPLVASIHDYGFICSSKALTKGDRIFNKCFTNECVFCGKDKFEDFVVEQNNPRELAEKILLALGDDELLKKLSADSRDLAEEYSWDKVGEKTVGLYRCVIKGEQI